MNALPIHSRDLLRRQFGDNMLRLRRELDMSQEELGFVTSLHRTEIGMLERGIRLPRLDTILKLTAGLEVSPNELLAGMAWRAGRLEAGSFVMAESRESEASTGQAVSHID
jgi:transcriptional regulator with XRE-family HTH domain